MTMWKHIHTMLYLMAGMLLLFCSCAKEEIEDISRVIDINVHVPSDIHVERSPGDPGTGSALLIPAHVYVYMVYTHNATTHISYYAQNNLAPESWTPVYNGANMLIRYDRTLSVPVPQTSEVKAYVIASDNSLSDLPSNISSEDEIKALQLSYSHDAICNVYAGIGTLFTDADLYPNQEIVCNHVAAKFDVTYNLSDVFRANYPTWRVESFTLKNLITEGYYFTPAENVVGTTTTSYTHTTTQGNHIYGRFDTYVFQPANVRFDWEVTLHDIESEKTATLTGTSADADFSSPYAAYFRLNLTINGINN